jgi:simple sugar transport system permease protein
MKRILRSHEFYVAIAIIVFSVIITLVNPAFFTLENFFDLLKGNAFLGILSVGVLIVLISGGIDISFTAIATVGMYVVAVVSKEWGGNMLTAFLLAGALGILLGSINALVTYLFNIPSIITTIATLNIYYGLLTVLSGGKWIYGLPAWFRDFSAIRVLTVTKASGATYGLSIIPVIWFVVLAGAWVILNRMILGRGIYAMGGNKTSARRVGFPIFRQQLFVYSFMGLLAGIAGVVQLLLVQTAAPNSIVGKELDVIAAVVLGGASLAGGVGTLTGTVLGVVLLAVLSNGLTLMRIPSYWYNVLIGLVIIISVSVSAYRRRARQQRATLVEIP